MLSGAPISSPGGSRWKILRIVEEHRRSFKVGDKSLKVGQIIESDSRVGDELVLISANND